ncbi:MAG: ATP-dependent helicase [Actinobacteria bacterium]|nr:ATP-dependent helicase [Actinomycetota bacterium]
MVCTNCSSKAPRRRCHGCPLGRNAPPDWASVSPLPRRRGRPPSDERDAVPEIRAPRLWLPPATASNAVRQDLNQVAGTVQPEPRGMVSDHDFLEALSRFRPVPDYDQGEAIGKPWNAGVHIVAGPGTGKTATLVLRILRVVFVDGVPPGSVLAMTFTRKAASELRSRILSWGIRLQKELESLANVPADLRDRVRSVDLNKVRTGTTDSISHAMLRDHRPAGSMAPDLATEYAASAIMRRDGLYDPGLSPEDIRQLKRLLLGLHASDRDQWNFTPHTQGDLLSQLWDRRFQDVVDWDAWVRADPEPDGPRHQVDRVHKAYLAGLTKRNLVDFPLLQARVVEAIRDGALDTALADLLVLFVDEYQDTNLLQETLYFEIASRCGGALTVVGDDDQSLFQFRGATVELFRQFPDRYASRFGRSPATVFLTVNYRSTPHIVEFVNRFVSMDKGYVEVRVPGKTALQTISSLHAHPVYGMFRDDEECLARDLASFIWDIFRGAGRTLPGGLVIADEHGDVGDCALLLSSPKDAKYDGQPRMPRLLRLELESLPSPIGTFNPRGEALGFNEVVAVLGGLLLECLDPDGSLVDQSFLADKEPQILRIWSEKARDYLSRADTSRELADYVGHWKERTVTRAGWTWSREVPGLDLFYALLQFHPGLLDDPETFVYLEAVAGQFNACAQVSGLGARIITDPDEPELSRRSVIAIIENVLGPIAGRNIGINEDLLVTYPRDRLSVMSIHQAKGLEFPITIVDVGSDIPSAHASNAFKRFPETGASAHRMEDLLRTSSALGVAERDSVNRAFDELYRQYFVAYSRPRHILLIVGCHRTSPAGPIRHVATGTTRDGVNRWRHALPYTPI